MLDDLAGKAVLVTGASTGIGAAAARAFGTVRARVAVHYNQSAEAARRVADDVRAVAPSSRPAAPPSRTSAARGGATSSTSPR